MIGKALAHYRVVELLGNGGMGEVYLARDEHLQRDAEVNELEHLMSIPFNLGVAALELDPAWAASGHGPCR